MNQFNFLKNHLSLFGLSAFLVCVLIFSSCGTNESEDERTFYSTYFMVDHLSYHFKRESEFVYYNSIGTEKRIKTLGYHQLRHDPSQDPIIEELIIQIKDLINPTLLFSINGSYEYLDSLQEYVPRLNVTAVPGRLHGSNSASVYFEDEMPLIPDDGLNFHDTLILRNRIFYDVYASVPDNADSDLVRVCYFNFRFGIVGFTDYNDVLWVYDSVD